MHDFNLHAPEGANKRRRILGRGQGSGRGTTAGKGSKGQKSRSGGKTYIGFEGGQMPLYRRLAHRGFSNYPFKKTNQIVSVGELAKHFKDGETVNVKTLVEKRLAKGSDPVKILSGGDISVKLTVDGILVSASAKEKIEKAGGQVTGLPEKKEKAAKSEKAEKGK